jgi:pimeloyl-ACP methyl ester carboxylesterase
MQTRFTAQHRGGSGTPVVLLHGFTDTWRTWDLVRPALEREFDVLAPTLTGHAGGPDAGDELRDTILADGVEQAMDAAGFETAHIVGNSLGGYVAMHLAERGRARSVTAFAPAGGWPVDDPSFAHACRIFRHMRRDLAIGAPLIGPITKLRLGRRYITRDVTTRYRHIPPGLLAHMARGARACEIAPRLLEQPDELHWHVDPDLIDCPVRIVWGTADRVLPWPVASSSFRTWLPDAEWIELGGIGHCPQLDAPQDVVRLVRDHVAAVERAVECAARSTLAG